MEKPVGLSQDAGWILGVRRTVPLPREEVWDHLTGPGLPDWLGVDALDLTRGATYARGQVRSVDPGRKVRLTWLPPGATEPTRLQLTLLDAATGTTVALHQELLTGPEQRAELLLHWTAVVEDLVETLSP